jgi:hypothetical protein
MNPFMEYPKHNPLEPAPGGHEMRDAAPRPVVIFAASLLAALAAVLWIGWKTLGFLNQRQETENQIIFPTHPLSEAMAANPPDPRLEPEPSHDLLPSADLTKVQMREQALIGPHAWGWIDSSHQFARVPVNQAIDWAVEHGLPQVLPSTQPANQPYMPAASALHGPGGVP